MKLLLIILLSTFIYACQPKEKGTVASNYEKLALYYKDTTFSELYVYPDDQDNGTLYAYEGKQYDEEAFKVLPMSVTHSLPWTEGFYGNFSFKITGNLTGFITRVPGKDASTSVELWLFDQQKDKIINSISLSDMTGDAGSYYYSNALLFFDNHNKLHILDYNHTSVDDYLDNEDHKTSISDDQYYSLSIVNDSLSQTILKDSTQLKRQFESQLQKMISLEKLALKHF